MNRIKLLALFLPLLIAMLPCTRAAQQDAPRRVELPNTEVHLLPAKSNGITYKLYINLPPSYAEGKKSYPVVFMLDADYSFALAKNISEHLSDRNDLPELVLVAIAYDGPLQYRLNRTRDYTPTYVPDGGYGPEYQKHSGGAPKFRQFLQTELIPFIEAKYRVTKERTLVGHSYGGLFGSWVLFTQPELFNHYILVSPSLWYDSKLMFHVEQEFAARQRTLSAKVYLTVGSHEVNDERDMVRDLQAFTAQIKRRSYRGLALQAQVMDDETHNTIFPLGLTRGLRFIYPIHR
ncbi:MAG: alpha/beta hydrolase-fold protein [Blastocatellia bacterium]